MLDQEVPSPYNMQLPGQNPEEADGEELLI